MQKGIDDRTGIIGSGRELAHFPLVACMVGGNSAFVRSNSLEQRNLCSRV